MNHQMSRRTSLFLLGVVSVGEATINGYSSQIDDGCNSTSVRCEWVAECLKRMLTIKPGMSRNYLMQFFTTEGGLSTADQRTVVSRDCRWFRVDVKFRRASNFESSGDRRKDPVQELDSDEIASISQPYLQFSILD